MHATLEESVRTGHDQYKKDSDNIMRRLDQIKDSMTRNVSNTKMLSENISKLSKYLPDEQEEAFVRPYGKPLQPDQYRQSLQKRLQKLFRDEKQMLRERPRGDERKPSRGPSAVPRSEKQFSMDEIDRKIKKLEKKYVKESQEGNNAQVRPQIGLNDKTTPAKSKVGKKNLLPLKEEQIKKSMRAEISEQMKRAQAASQWKVSEQLLQIKQDLGEMKRRNEQLASRLDHIDQRRKSKVQAKHLLLNILLKFEAIERELQFRKGNNGPQVQLEEQKKLLEKELQKARLRFQSDKMECEVLQQKQRALQKQLCGRKLRAK